MSDGPLDAFAPYLGSYASTTGEGLCPTGVNVRFHEHFTLERCQDWVRYDQRAVRADDGLVLHTEGGVFRADGSGGLELALVMNSGRLEFGTARWEGAASLVTESTRFHNDRLGVRANRRAFRFDADGCDKELWLATPAWPELRRHMWGRLTRDRAVT